MRLLVRGALPVCVAFAIAGCSHFTSQAGYPSGPYTFHFKTPVPDLSFDGLDANGAPAQINLHDYFEPDASASRLLILRVGAGWCGTCDWNLRHTGELFALDIAPSLALVDLVVADDDNVPATTAFLPQYESRVDAPQPVAIDPMFQLRPAMLVDGPLPLVVVVDRRTMQIEQHARGWGSSLPFMRRTSYRSSRFSRHRRHLRSSIAPPARSSKVIAESVPVMSELCGGGGIDRDGSSATIEGRLIAAASP